MAWSIPRGLQIGTQYKKILPAVGKTGTYLLLFGGKSPESGPLTEIDMAS